MKEILFQLLRDIQTALNRDEPRKYRHHVMDFNIFYEQIEDAFDRACEAMDEDQFIEFVKEAKK